MKITTADCVKAIVSMRPGDWKRVSKRGNAGSGIVREFTAGDVPEVKAVVVEADGQISSVKFEDIDAMPEGQKYYFEQDDSEDSRALDSVMFAIIPVEFWDKYHHMDDGVGAHNVNMPDGFYEAMEGVFEYDGSAEEGKKKLLEAGFIPIPPPGIKGYFPDSGGEEKDE